MVFFIRIVNFVPVVRLQQRPLFRPRVSHSPTRIGKPVAMPCSGIVASLFPSGKNCPQSEVVGFSAREPLVQVVPNVSDSSRCAQFGQRKLYRLFSSQTMSGRLCRNGGRGRDLLEYCVKCVVLRLQSGQFLGKRRNTYAQLNDSLLYLRAQSA